MQMEDNVKQIENIETIAIVGAGLIGIGWATVFFNAGYKVRVFDREPVAREQALRRIDENCAAMRAHCLITHHMQAADAVTLCDTLADAVANADYVQESVLETIEVKTRVSEELDQAARPDVIIGSSSSGIPASQFTQGLAGRSRFLVVHPVNPPHLIPVVEIVPSEWTDPQIAETVRALMDRVGQAPVMVNREVEGFVLNRLQGALLNEAWALYSEGVATAADIDLTVSKGLGLRWSFMGPFETIDLNAPGGIVDYAARLNPLYHRMALERSEANLWPAEAITAAEGELRAAGDGRSIADRTVERDLRLMALASHKLAQST